MGGRMALHLGEQGLLHGQIFQRRLDDEIRVADAFCDGGCGRHMVGGALIVFEIAQVGGDARAHRLQRCGGGVVNADLMAMEREDLRNAVAHEARAQNADSRFTRHVVSPFQPAV